MLRKLTHEEGTHEKMVELIKYSKSPRCRQPIKWKIMTINNVWFKWNVHFEKKAQQFLQ